MNINEQISRQIRAFRDGGNYTGVALQPLCADLDWQEAVRKVGSLNTIAALVFHLNYYVHAVIGVLQGKALDAHDSKSYDLPPIKSENDWKNLLLQVYGDIEVFAREVERLPEDKLNNDFADARYGSYLRNITGAMEHAHYHLGQIAIIKKMIREGRV